MVSIDYGSTRFGGVREKRIGRKLKNKIIKIQERISGSNIAVDLTDFKRQEEDKHQVKSVSENRIGRQKALGFDPFLSPKEAADYLGVSVRFIYERIFSGELESQPMGRLRRIRLSTLENWLVRQQNGEVR